MFFNLPKHLVALNTPNRSRVDANGRKSGSTSRVVSRRRSASPFIRCDHLLMSHRVLGIFYESRGRSMCTNETRHHLNKSLQPKQIQNQSSMPRFQEAYVRLLKHTMLQRLPNCEFTKEDVSSIASDTELDEVQIVLWATNFRARFTSLDDREKFLRNTAEKVLLELFQVMWFSHLIWLLPQHTDETKANRFYVSGFNIDEDFVKNLVIHKARNAGDFTINFIHAAFNPAAFHGEIVIEFYETIRVCTLMTQLEAVGACQVTVVTFKHFDASESASNALLRVWMAADKTGCRFHRGVVSAELLDKTHAKYDAEKQKQIDHAKDEAKLQAGIQMSLDDMGDKVNHLDGKVEIIQQGICTIIPDYQKLLKESNDKLIHKTKEVDRIEQKMGMMTRDINKLTAEAEEMNRSSRLFRENAGENILFLTRKHEREISDRNELLATKDEQIRHLREMLDVYRALDNVKHLIDLGQSAKRTRGDD